MALKKLSMIDERFPVIKRPRLGAAPPPDDVLDNVGEPEGKAKAADAGLAGGLVSDRGGAGERQQAGEADASVARSARRKERATRRSSGAERNNYGRRYRKTGRTFQFGARTTPEFAEAVRQIAAQRNVTLGELLEDMKDIYDTIHAAAQTRGSSVTSLLADLKKLSNV
jgi:hypothetical protein